MNERLLRVGVSARTYDQCAPLPSSVETVLVDGGATFHDVEVVWRRYWDRTGWLIDLLDRLPALRWVHTDTAGVDRLPLARLRWLGVRLSNARGAHTPAVAEWALGAMLLAARELARSVTDTTRRTWSPHQGDVLLKGRTVMVLGLGNIGRYLSALCNALGMSVVGVSHSGSAVPGVEVVPVTGSWRDLLPDTSFLVNCLPLTPATEGLVNEAILTRLARPGWLINVGRGQTLVEADLVTALRSRALQGAVLDTFVTEPLPPENALWDCPGIVISPHAAAFTDTTERRTREVFVAELGQYMAGHQLRNIIDLERGY